MPELRFPVESFDLVQYLNKALVSAEGWKGKAMGR